MRYKIVCHKGDGSMVIDRAATFDEAWALYAVYEAAFKSRRVWVQTVLSAGPPRTFDYANPGVSQ